MKQTRVVASRTITTPQSVSSELQAIIGATGRGFFTSVPQSAKEWKSKIAAFSKPIEAALPALQEELRVDVTPIQLGNVSAFEVVPREMGSGNSGRALLHFHGGARVLLPGLAGTREAIVMAGFCGIRVLTVDYRMPPDHPFPAALDDAVLAYRALLQTTPPNQIGFLGYSAGGSLCFTTLLRTKAEGLPMPGAIVAGTPTVDLTGEGDTLQTNAFVDNVLETADAFIRGSIELYAAGRDPADPLISPIYGDVTGFPPALLTSGTRDLYLSHTVRMHRKLRAAGIEAVLQVWEGQSHGQYMASTAAPETREYHDEVSAFLDRHLV